MVLEGLLLRLTAVNGSRSGELIAQGDLVRPWLEAVSYTHLTLPTNREV